MPDLLLSERGHAQACNLDVGCEAHHTIHYSGVIDGEDELSSCPRGASSVKRGSGGSSGAPTPVRGESDKKRIKRENSGSQTPVQQASKTATTPASTDKKGLRSFSGQVCQKVRDKKTTTYNEVADELVKDFALSELNEELKYDEKNIRRRDYDALNVLMALEIISKDKKSISSSSQMERGSSGATTAGRTLGGADGIKSWMRKRPLSSLYCRRHTL